MDVLFTILIVLSFLLIFAWSLSEDETYMLPFLPILWLISLWIWVFVGTLGDPMNKKVIEDETISNYEVYPIENGYRLYDPNTDSSETLTDYASCKKIADGLKPVKRTQRREGVGDDVYWE